MNDTAPHDLSYKEKLKSKMKESPALQSLEYFKRMQLD